MKLRFLAVAACIACELPPEKPAEVPVPVVAATPPVATPKVASPAAGSGDGVQLAVTEASGLDPGALAKVYGAARESLAHCHQPGGGTVHVRIVRQGTSLHMHIEAGATLDPTAHRCVLESLSTVELPDTASNGGGPAVPPSGFTSLLTLSW
jgi:hypothetical protein